MHYESNLAGYEDGLEEGAERERDRLRLLLERCLAACEISDSGPWPPGETPTSLRLAVVADLRRELGKEG